MSLSFILVCPETKQKLWIGQGHHGEDGKPHMEVLYYGIPEVMERLQRFLDDTQGKSIQLAVSDYGHHNDEDGWTEL